jgi:sec-independent protein translocase protein TatA
MNNIFLFIGTSELILIAVVVLLLFGGRKLPELMRGLGEGIKGFKDGMKDVKTEENDKDTEKKQE